MIFQWFFVLAFLCAPAAAQWKLVWSDDFTGSVGAAPDASKWSFETGAGGWGNGELERYTDSRENAALDGHGKLVITARRAAAGAFTSARMKTAGKFEIEYGRMEARIKIPAGQGMWPAFWMLGANIRTRGIGWPKCGEIDIMENIGREPGVVHGTVHGPGYSGAQAIGKPFALPAGQRFADEFHIFAVEWSADSLDFYVDATRYHHVTRSTLPAGTDWVFDHPFFLLLNLAVGGAWPGNPDATTLFPQAMLVDYVRVYQR